MSSSIASLFRDGWGSDKKISRTFCRKATFSSHSFLSCNWRNHSWAKVSAEWLAKGTLIAVFSGSPNFQTEYEVLLRQACVQLAPLSLRALINSKHFFSSSKGLDRPLEMTSTSKVVWSFGCNASHWKSEAMHWRALSNMRVSMNVQNNPMRSLRSADIIQWWQLGSWASLTHFSKAP